MGHVMTEHPFAHSGRGWSRPLAGLLIGLVPGALLILVALLAIRGEPQLTVGTAGMWLAVAGATIGLVLALRTRSGPTRRRGTSKGCSGEAGEA
jgi:hypothetical protein